jgi:hypothetical protein
MVATADELRTAETGILAALADAQAPFSPADLVDLLKAKGISEYSTRVALWYLIDRNRIELTMDRLLRLRPRTPEDASRRLVAAGA